MVKRLTPAERLIEAILERAAHRPDKWHKIGYLDATKKAAELLAKRGVIEIWRETGLYRIKQKNNLPGSTSIAVDTAAAFYFVA